MKCLTLLRRLSVRRAQKPRGKVGWQHNDDCRTDPSGVFRCRLVTAESSVDGWHWAPGRGIYPAPPDRAALAACSPPGAEPHSLGGRTKTQAWPTESNLLCSTQRLIRAKELNQGRAGRRLNEAEDGSRPRRQARIMATGHEAPAPPEESPAWWASGAALAQPAKM